AARSGLLVRDRQGLEEARRVDTVVFDKTGTLTTGEFRVVDVATIPGLAPDEALRLAAATEHDSEHAIAQGIVKSAEEKGIALPDARGFEALPGQGVRAEVEGRELSVGGPALGRRLGVPAPGPPAAGAGRARGGGHAGGGVGGGGAPAAAGGGGGGGRP